MVLSPSKWNDRSMIAERTLRTGAGQFIFYGADLRPRRRAAGVLKILCLADLKIRIEFAGAMA